MAKNYSNLQQDTSTSTTKYKPSDDPLAPGNFGRSRIYEKTPEEKKISYQQQSHPIKRSLVGAAAGALAGAAFGDLAGRDMLQSTLAGAALGGLGGYASNKYATNQAVQQLKQQDDAITRNNRAFDSALDSMQRQAEEEYYNTLPGTTSLASKPDLTGVSSIDAGFEKMEQYRKSLAPAAKLTEGYGARLMREKSFDLARGEGLTARTSLGDSVASLNNAIHTNYAAGKPMQVGLSEQGTYTPASEIRVPQSAVESSVQAQIDNASSSLAQSPSRIQQNLTESALNEQRTQESKANTNLTNKKAAWYDREAAASIQAKMAQALNDSRPSAKQEALGMLQGLLKQGAIDEEGFQSAVVGLATGKLGSMTLKVYSPEARKSSTGTIVIRDPKTKRWVPASEGNGFTTVQFQSGFDMPGMITTPTGGR